jgi:sec-independent protein translocase protein TatA
MIGQTEILIISGVIILLFGATALPKLARSLGKAKKEFQKGLKEGSGEEEEPGGGDGKSPE